MLSLNGALIETLTEALTSPLIEPRLLQTPLPPLEQPYFIELEEPSVEQPYFVEPESPQQVESVSLALYGDGFFIVEGRHGQQLYTRVGDFRINDRYELVTKNGLRLLGYLANGNGEIASDNLAPLVIPYGLELLQETAALKFYGVLNPSMGVGEGTSTNFFVYDKFGYEVDLSITAILSAKNADSTEFRWTVNDAPSTGLLEELGSGMIAFDSKGDLIGRVPQSILLEQNAEVISIELDFSQVKVLGEVDAQGNPISSLNPIQEGGFPPGVFQTFIITGAGEIQGQFANGMQRLLGQLQLAAIPNPQGLRKVAKNLYAATSTSGEPRLGEPSSSALGSVTHLPPGYIVTEEGYIHRENESPPEPSPSWQPSPSGLRYPWQLRSVNYKWIATRAENHPPSNDEVVLGKGFLTFTDEGLVDTGESPTIRISGESGQDLVIGLDFGTVTGLPKIDSLGRPISSLNVVFQDGFPPGVLEKYSISGSGEIIGRFSSGLDKHHGFERGGKHHGGRTRFRHLRSEQQPDKLRHGQEFDPLEIAWSNFRRVFRH